MGTPIDWRLMQNIKSLETPFTLTRESMDTEEASLNVDLIIDELLNSKTFISETKLLKKEFNKHPEKFTKLV